MSYEREVFVWSDMNVFPAGGGDMQGPPPFGLPPPGMFGQMPPGMRGPPPPGWRGPLRGPPPMFGGK